MNQVLDQVKKKKIFKFVSVKIFVFNPYMHPSLLQASLITQSPTGIQILLQSKKGNADRSMSELEACIPELEAYQI